MIGAGLGLWIALSTTMMGQAAPKTEPPRSVDPRLVFERIAAEPEIVTPTGLAVDGRGRVLVIESHTHFRPKDYKGPPADRIRVFEDRDGDGRPECVGNFFEGTRFTMNLAVARDGSVFVATRAALYRLQDRDGDGRADGTAGGRVPAPIVRLDSTGDYPHNGLSGFAFDSLRIGSTSNWARNLVGRLPADTGVPGRHHALRRRGGRQHLPMPARRDEARARGDRVLEPVPHDVRPFRPLVCRG